MNLGRRIFLHAIIWIALIAFLVVISNRRGEGIAYSTLVNFGYFGIVNITIFYINYVGILPFFLKTRRYWTCAISIIALIIVFGFIKLGIAVYFKDVIWIKEHKMDHPTYIQRYYMSTLFVSGFFVFISTAIKFMSDWFVNEKERRVLANEKLTAELAFLRSQINPHFLFNCLNNIYSLAYQKSDHTAEAVMKLSEIMRYMLYESNDSRVELSKEIRYLENFIELQKLRFKGSTYVELSVAGVESHLQIVPLVLIPFVENAFKHGDSADPDNPIRIRISVTGDELQFSITNRVSSQNKDETGGIGLVNVQRRLDLLYPGKYHLNISRNGIYSAQLSLIL
jgi:two-component system, LytTR family, sensor kinase